MLLVQNFTLYISPKGFFFVLIILKPILPTSLGSQFFFNSAISTHLGRIKYFRLKRFYGLNMNSPCHSCLQNGLIQTFHLTQNCLSAIIRNLYKMDFSNRPKLGINEQISSSEFVDNHIKCKLSLPVS